MTELTEEMLANAERLYRIARAREGGDRQTLSLAKWGLCGFAAGVARGGEDEVADLMRTANPALNGKVFQGLLRTRWARR
jgi:hypothetical protein